MQVSTIGLDLAKQVFQVHGIDSDGAVVLRRRLRRSEVVMFFSTLPSCLVGIEACATAHHWARELSTLGHKVRLIPPSYVKPYVKRGKTDAADAEAICEAVSRPSMRFVPLKSAEQQSALTLHRSRDLLVRQRTMLVNAVRAHFAEFGVVAPQGIGRVGELAALLIEDDATALPPLARQAVRALLAQLQALDEQISSLEAAIVASHGTTRRAAGLHRSQASDRSPLRRWLRASLMRASLTLPGISQHGLVQPRRNRPEGRNGRAGSPSRAILICVGCS